MSGAPALLCTDHVAARYGERLAARKARIVELARHLGWRTLFHHTSESPRAALLWLYMALGERA